MSHLPKALALLAVIALLVIAAGCGGSDSTSTATTAKPKSSIAEEEATPGDHSIQNFGSEAQGSEAEEVTAAMRSFLRAMGDRNFSKVCTDLSASNLEQLRQLAKASPKAPSSCSALLAELVSPAGLPEAKRAAVATVSRVRIKDGNAFVLFRPPGGKLSYFVMKEEGGEWKATSLAPGVPLNP